MLLKKEFLNVKCDCCGCIADERMWHKTEESARREVRKRGWLIRRGKSYCPECWDFDGNDKLIIKKGNDNER